MSYSWSHTACSLLKILLSFLKAVLTGLRMLDIFFQHISLSFALKIAHPTVVLLETVIFLSGCF